jgi:NTE family protein
MSFVERLASRRSRHAGDAAAGGGITRTTAVVLSGGSVFGAVQVGQLRALAEAGIAGDIWIGCSVGALNAAFMSAGPGLDRVEELREIWTGLRSSDVFHFRSRRHLASLIRGADHLCDPMPLRRLIDRCCPIDDLAEAGGRLQVVTTDLDEPAPRWWSAGPAVDVLLASAALPGIFPSVQLEGHRHVDGGVLVPVPSGRAVELGATDVYVCDVSSRGRPRLPARLGALSNLLEAFNTARFAIDPTAAGAGGAGPARVTVLPTPDTEGLSMADFSQTNRLIEEAYQLAAAALAEPATPVLSPEAA